MTSAPNQQQKVDLLYLSAIRPRSCQFWSLGASKGLRGRFPGPRKDLGSPTTRPEGGKTVVRLMKTPILSHFEHTSPSCPRSKTTLRLSAYQNNGLIIRKTTGQSRNFTCPPKPRPAFGRRAKKASRLRRPYERVRRRFAPFCETVWAGCFTAIPIWIAPLAEGVIKYLTFRAVEGVIR